MSEVPPGVAVCLTFDFDGPAGWIASGMTTPSPLSRGEFAAVGMRRVLDLLAERRLPATFFTPATTALTYPDLVRELVEAGHELGHHGWAHETPSELDRDREDELLRRASDALGELAGAAPTGYRAPGWALSPHTVELLDEQGFLYESSLMGHDFAPYWCRRGDVPDADGPFRFGDPTSVVELPVSWHLDDFPHFEFMATDSLALPGLRPPSQVLEIWTAELDYLHERIGDGMLVITMHPEFIGRAHRLAMLERFLDHAAAQARVRFSRCADYAREWRQLNGRAAR